MEASHPAFGFIVEVEPGVTYYHVGDTCLFSDMRMYRELYHPNVMTVGISRFKEPYPPCEMPVSYTHLDVYKRQAHLLLCVLQLFHWRQS